MNNETTHFNQKDMDMLERLIYKNNDDLSIAIARSFERLEERIDAQEARIYSRISEIEENIETHTGNAIDHSRKELTDLITANHKDTHSMLCDIESILKS